MVFFNFPIFWRVLGQARARPGPGLAQVWPKTLQNTGKLWKTHHETYTLLEIIGKLKVFQYFSANIFGKL